MRTSRPSGHPSSLSAGGRRTLAALVVTAIALTGCGRDAAVVEGPALEIEPGRPIDVTGRPGLVDHDLSTHATLVFPEGSAGDARVPADEAAIQAAAEDIRVWLDTVLSERNRGLTTTVERSEVDPRAFARAIGADGPSTDGVLETQVNNATYLIEVAYLGGPGWALARVESILASSDEPMTEIGRRLDTFVFTIDEDGTIAFVALEVAP